MNIREYLLTQLSEECSEIAQMCGKSQRFGLREVYDNTLANPERHDNLERLIGEINDFFGVLLFMQRIGILPKNIHRRKLIKAKVDKIGKYMRYAQKLKTLQ